MYAIKALYKPEETTKTWVVLDVVPGFLPYIVEDVVTFLQDNIRRVTHLSDSFDEINAEEAFVFGVKGRYATRSFNPAEESNFIGLPYNVTPVPSLIGSSTWRASMFIRRRCQQRACGLALL
eukprot:scaffold132431_cov54-Attheya_sp.AAC.1